VEAPYGAHPTALHARYDYDIDHLEYAFEQSKDEKKFGMYLDQFVYGVNSQRGYLKRIWGSKRLLKLRTNLPARAS